MHSKTIQNLINQFSKLPSIGPKTAERLVFHLISRKESEWREFSEAISSIKDNIKICDHCFNFSETNPCSICADPGRDQSLICVAAKPQDVIALEKAKFFTGVYHILGGQIDALENISPQDLKIKELAEKAKTAKEVILALNPDLEGETTTLYLTKVLKQSGVKITRLARGLPMGADLEYADEITLENALKGREII